MLEVLYSQKFPIDVANTIITNNRFVYCPNCHRPHDIDAIERHYECDDFDVFEFTCTHCNTTHYIKKNIWTHQSTKFRRAINTNKYGHLAKPAVRYSVPTGIKTNEMIIHDKEKGKLSLFIRFVNVITTEKSAFFEPYYSKYIVNYKNHTVYVVNNKTYKGRPAFGHNGSTLLNYTNATSGLWSSALHWWAVSVDAMESLFRNYFNITGMPMCEELMQSDYVTAHNQKAYNSISDYKSRLFETIITANRFPNALIQRDVYRLDDTIGNYHGQRFVCQTFAKNFPRELTDYQEFVKIEIQKHNLPKSKTFWKMYLNDVKFLDRTAYLVYCGFQNRDVIRMVLKDNAFFSYFDNDCDKTNYDLTSFSNTYDSFRQIIKRMLKASPENSVGKKLCGANYYHYINDTVMMYKKIRQYDKSLLNAVNWAGTIIDIHDDLSKISNKIRYANVSISYRDTDKLLEREVGEFTFSLAVDTNELVLIGQEMKICVGSYRDSVLSKRSTIVSIKSNNKYVGCIELDSSKHLIQMKGKYNRYLVGNVCEAAREWVGLVDVKEPNRCCDFQNLGKEIQSQRDYHQLELDEDGNVFDNTRNDYFAFDFNDDLPF